MRKKGKKKRGSTGGNRGNKERVLDEEWEGKDNKGAVKEIKTS